MGVFWVLVAIVVVVAMLSQGEVPPTATDDDDNAEERWAELVSADQCDAYWDPPGEED